MYIRDGIAYADEPCKEIKVMGVRPMDGHQLWLRFNTGEIRVFDFSLLLSAPAFEPLNDEQVFRSAYIDYGMVVWNDGDIDISPELLYRDSVAVNNIATA